MNENPSKLEQLMMQIAEWKARFLQEREWRESVQEEKKDLQEKYEQIVYELGTQKKQIEQLEEKVHLLGSGEEHANVEAGTEEAEEDTSSRFETFFQERHIEKNSETLSEETETPEEVAWAEDHSGTDDFLDILTEELEKEAQQHHIYTNPNIYEPRFHPEAFEQMNPTNMESVTEANEEDPHILHRYDPSWDNEKGFESLSDILHEEFGDL